MSSKQSKGSTSKKRKGERLKGESESPKRKTLFPRFSKKEKKSSKEKTSNSNSDEMMPATISDTYNLYPPLSSKQESKDVIKDEVDGGPVEFYQMKKRTSLVPRGPVYIISNFVGNEKFSLRTGGPNDVGKLTDCFKPLGFNVQTKGNLTSKEMQACCSDWAMKDYRTANCVIVVILTHGIKPDLLQGVDGEFVALDALVSPFRKFNRTLVGKPVIFFIQACRGDSLNIGVRDEMVYDSPQSGAVAAGRSTASVQSKHVFGTSTNLAIENSGFLPPQADHLIVFATGIGYPAYRGTDTGSWYVDELTKVLNEEYSGSRSKKDPPIRHLLDVITEVQGRVSNKKKDVLGLSCVQMPEFISRLRGPIFL